MTVEVVKPPHTSNRVVAPSIFLGGTIDMGNSVDWQTEIATVFAEIGLDVTLYNPRRDFWNMDSVPEAHDPLFREQVEWELKNIRGSDAVIFYFAPSSKSPITLLELGLCAASNSENTYVCCPDGFYRKGNVEIVCEQYGVEMFSDLDGLVERIVDRFGENDE